MQNCSLIKTAAILFSLVLCTTLSAQLIGQTAPKAKSAPAKVDFKREVQPLLKAHCFQCHSGDQQQGGLRLDTKRFAMKGGISGLSILPGKIAQSLLLKRIEGKGGLSRMPLGFTPLSMPEAQLITTWIDQGALWDENAKEEIHWAYLKPVRKTPPSIKLKTWVKNPIDNFVLAKLESNGLKPSPPTSKEILIRRVTLDLTGIPPTPQETDAFLADKSIDAYEKVVTLLLASPHYGERWARPWLDLARYADTNGYEKDSRRSIWLYRDWVIDALNKDMGYDQFTIEQIAGDLLPNATPSQKIATGFHRNTMTNEEGGVDQEEARWLTQVDRVGTTGSVWLGSTLGCAQCHDHKYDPFSQKDFYRVLAFYEHTAEPAFQSLPPELEARKTALQTEIHEMEERAKVIRLTEEGAKAFFGKLESLKKELAALVPNSTLVMAEKTDNLPPSTFVRIKGAFLNPSEKVTAGTPAVLPPMAASSPQNRLGLANWLVAPENPLTARVAVNRMWEQCFGQGIVETSEDFGTQGRKPTHPELLDWLATEFVRQNWSQKAILKLIVTSAAYRQSSKVSSALLESDPYNKLISRGPRFRMEAEMLRDSALSIGGLLSLKMGGVSVFPLQPDGIWNVPYSGDQWITSPGEDKYRRGVYTFWRRSAPYPAFVTFDATSREFCTIRRIRTNTPLQAMTTLNDPAFLEAARGLALRVRKEGGAELSDRISYAFRCCVSRKPTPLEASRIAMLHRQETKRYLEDANAAIKLIGMKLDAEPKIIADYAAWVVLANVMLNLDETLTKE